MTSRARDGILAIAVMASIEAIVIYEAPRVVVSTWILAIAGVVFWHMTWKLRLRVGMFRARRRRMADAATARVVRRRATS